MENRDRCPFCGALILPNEKFCSQCGSPLTGSANTANTANTADAVSAADAASAGKLNQASMGVGEASGWRPGLRPCTIGQLQDFCAYNEMPLERMRFFLDEDYKQARAFGIYRDADRFVVYKNKADGSRAVRYSGPDEAHAVGELYDKLLDECHRRDIWPDGKPADLEKRRKAGKRRLLAIAVVSVLLIGTLGFVFSRVAAKKHANDGYYRFGGPGIYYCYGDDWYYNGDDDWVRVDYGPYNDYDDRSDYFVGDTYDSRWGYSDFEDSSVWAQIQVENRTSSSDYSGWDSGDTDWGSDW